MEYIEKGQKSMYIMRKIVQKYKHFLHLLILKTKNNHLKNNKQLPHNILNK